ncbi:MAG: beta-xylosidase [Actinomycetota bacterium]|nr:beta-xylosidase [Actinomycetota bacterium]
MSASSSSAPGTDAELWRDSRKPASERVEDLLARMTLDEKVAQLCGVWVGASKDGAQVAPHQHEQTEGPPDWDAIQRNGLGQFTRPFGTAPVDPALGARSLARSQADLVASGRFGIPAMAHEECLAGFTTWAATIFPVPLSWGAAFDTDVVRRMSEQIGHSMRVVGVHQGLAPVLDIARDPRWGRCEETIGSDPYLVSAIGTQYVAGLESTGIISTLKHFAGYSVSAGGRNLAPVSMGPREVIDVLLPSFEAALRVGGARSVMNAYIALDGMPVAADPTVFTTLLRDDWGFTGTVVADYFAIAFLQVLHHVADGPADAAAQALAAGIDVELPTLRCFGEPLTTAVREGVVPEALVDRAARRVLLQKCELGLLDPDWSPVPSGLAGTDEDTCEGSIDLDPPVSQAIARELAEKAVVLVANRGTLPLAPTTRIALVGPNADEAMAMLGCYSFPSHVLVNHPDVPLGVTIPTVFDALRAEFDGATVEYVAGCDISEPGQDGFQAAADLAAAADVCVAVLGDRAALFGRGTSGEGCDASDLRLPGEQGALLEALLATGKPVVLVLISGRPYALGAYADRLAATVQAFFPGQAGAGAIAGVLSGRVNPSGHLPMEIPRRPSDVVPTYLAQPLGQLSDVSSVDPTPLYPFGHGLSYTTFEWQDGRVDSTTMTTSGDVTVSCVVTNSGQRAGADIVQLYLHDPLAQVARPVRRLIGFARVELEPGRSRRVSMRVDADLTSFAGRACTRIVEPGAIELLLSRSSEDAVFTLGVDITGEERPAGFDRVMFAEVTVEDVF